MRTTGTPSRIWRRRKNGRNILCFWTIRLSWPERLHPAADRLADGQIHRSGHPGSTLGRADQLVDHRRCWWCFRWWNFLPTKSRRSTTSMMSSRPSSGRPQGRSCSPPAPTPSPRSTRYSHWQPVCWWPAACMLPRPAQSDPQSPPPPAGPGIAVRQHPGGYYLDNFVDPGGPAAGRTRGANRDVRRLGDLVFLAAREPPPGPGSRPYPAPLTQIKTGLASKLEFKYHTSTRPSFYQGEDYEHG